MNNKNIDFEDELDKGFEFLKDLKFEQALEIFDEVLEKDPVNLDAWYFKAITYRNLKQHENELLCYDKIIKIDPDEAVWYNKGFVLSSLGRFTDAIECYETALNIDPNHPYAEIRMRIVLKKLDYEERP